MRTYFLGFTAAVALCAGMTQARAQPIEEVVITGRLEESLPQELARYGTRVGTISAQEIQDGGFYDITGALQNLAPGMYIAPRAGAFDYVQISFQGSRTQDVLWLVDGIRINNRLYATTTPVDTIPAHGIERIEMLEGGQSLFYGTQGVAGAVNVVTRAFSDTPDGSMSFGIDSNTGRHINGYFRDTLGNHQFVIYGSHDQAEGFRPFREADMQPSLTDRKRGYNVTSLGGKYGIQLTDAVRLSTTYQHTDAELDHAQVKNAATAENVRDEDILSAKIDFAPTDEIEFFFKGYYHWWDAYYSQTNNDLANLGNLIVISDHEFWGFEDYGANLLAKFAPEQTGFEYFLGYDFQSYSGRDDVFLIGPQTESVQAPFAQIRTTDDLFPDVRLAAGLRYNAPSGGESSTVWNVSGQWDITENLFVRGTGGTAFRLPSAYELYVIDPCCEQGNPNLKPEESSNLNLSIGGNLPFGNGGIFSWEIIGFYRDITNRITIIFDPVAGVDTFDNSGSTVEVRGAELILNAALREDFSASFSHSFNSSEATGTGVQLQDIPESITKAVFDFHPMNLPFGASVTVNHVGQVYRTVLGRQDYGDYTVVDLAARLFLDEDRRHRIGARMENAFNTEYATRVRSTTPDGGGAPFVYHHVGTPQTFHLTYTVSMN